MENKMSRTHNRITLADVVVGTLATLCAVGAVYCVLVALGSL
jgi:hypothetical protein